MPTAAPGQRISVSKRMVYFVGRGVSMLLERVDIGVMRRKQTKEGCAGVTEWQRSRRVASVRRQSQYHATSLHTRSCNGMMQEGPTLSNTIFLPLVVNKKRATLPQTQVFSNYLSTQWWKCTTAAAYMVMSLTVLRNETNCIYIFFNMTQRKSNTICLIIKTLQHNGVRCSKA